MYKINLIKMQQITRMEKQVCDKLRNETICRKITIRKNVRRTKQKIRKVKAIKQELRESRRSAPGEISTLN